MHEAMKKLTVGLVSAAALAIAAVAAPHDAYAGSRGGAVAAGIIGGIAAGALIGGAIAAPPPPPPAYYPAYAPVAGYEPYAAYGGPVPVGCPGGYWARRPLYDRWGNVVSWSRPRFFCPAY
jgi:hypothetical protein